MAELLARFTQVIVLYNPASTHAAQAKRRIAELRKLFSAERVVVIETSPKGAAANRRLLVAQAAQLGPQTLLCVAAGDGTVGLTIETLVSHPDLPDEARQTPILPLWGGNANDLAHMLNGVSFRTRLDQVLRKGRVVAVRPLLCRLTLPGGKQHERIAVCYVSFGATALAAARLNDPQIRNHPLDRWPGGRFVKEFMAGFRALTQAPLFAVKEQGNVRPVYERAFYNGSRFAKIEALPMKLTDDAFIFHTIEEKKLSSALPKLFRLVRKRPASAIRRQSNFTVERATLAQFDGETMEIPAGTKVEVGLSPRPFYAPSLLLK